VSSLLSVSERPRFSVAGLARARRRSTVARKSSSASCRRRVWNPLAVALAPCARRTRGLPVSTSSRVPVPTGGLRVFGGDRPDGESWAARRARRASDVRRRRALRVQRGSKSRSSSSRSPTSGPCWPWSDRPGVGFSVFQTTHCSKQVHF
jgi:hypothetical protein